ncbi:MAG TPA: CHAT domain-containing protein [Thermoanaerobaculia bacterium]|nr:CHAT domain-containing protein [Thermoanaerobaculia bacterium]
MAVVIAAILIVAGWRPAYRTYRTAVMRRALTELIDSDGIVTRHHARLSCRTRSEVLARTGLASVQLRAAAARVVECANDLDSVEARRAAGVAHYAAARFEASAREFQSAAAATHSASDWSDVAAAELSAALTGGAPQKLVPALVAANRAVAIDAHAPSASCNRAAVIEAMGLRRVAHAEWQRCLTLERDSVLRVGLRERVDATNHVAEDDAWPPSLAAVMHASPSRVSVLARDVARRFRQHARIHAESVLPAAWAEAVLAGDEERATQNLDVARELASGVQELSGDTFASECMAVIEAAAHDPMRRSALASAYLDYREARALRDAGDAESARVKLLRSARVFADMNSPMSRLARSYASGALAEQSRNAEAAMEAETLLREMRTAPGAHYGLTALVLWQIAHSRGVMGHWDAALAAATESASLYDKLHETVNGGAMENMLAEIFDVLGRPAQAWDHRRRAFELLTLAGNAHRLQVSLGGSSRILMRDRNLPAALALLDLEIGAIPSSARADLVADAMARRASARAANGDARGARQDIVRARAASARIPDAKVRAKLDADIDAAVGLAERRANPKTSIDALTRAIAYATANERAILLPELFLERGRAHLALRAEEVAIRDFESGIEGVAAQRRQMTDFALSGTVPDAAEALFAEAMRIAVRRRDATRAFAIAQRARGQALLDRLARTAADVTAARGSLPAGTVVVQYVVLPEQVIVLTWGRNLQMDTIAIDSQLLEARVVDWLSIIRNGAAIRDVQSAGADLHRLLIGPVRGRLADASTIVFIPSKFLESLPWGALYDAASGHYLIEDVFVTTAPSAAFAVYRTPSTESALPQNALIIGNPHASSSYADLPPLPAAEAESRTIASLYRSSILLTGDAATKRRFLDGSRDAAVIHFTGHAVSSERSEQQSFLVFSADVGESGLLYSHDIARMSLERTRLVVLAACGTLRGATVHLDGAPSIAQSFLAAGVPLVVGTLWDVEDQSAATLFKRIHRAIAQGTPVLAAVREAQLVAIRSDDPDSTHPRTWAGLMLTGRLER